MLVPSRIKGFALFDPQWLEHGHKKPVTLLAGLLLLLGFATILAPTPLARFLLAQQAEVIGVEVDGLDTVGLDLLSSTIEAGPVQITAPSAPPGELGRLSLRYDMKGIFQGRILIESLVLDGIDLKIQRRPDSTLWINGVELETLLASATGDRAAREGALAAPGRSGSTASRSAPAKPFWKT